MKLTLIVPASRKTIEVFRKDLPSQIDKIIIIHPDYHVLMKNRSIVSIKGNYSSSSARNIGIIKSDTDIIAFTDDDCELNIDWAKNIKKRFDDKKIMIVFGQTLSFSYKNSTFFTPCTFSKRKSGPITNKISRHWLEVGFSNNMAVKKEVFEKIGNFKWWLGPGSIGSNGEDAEFIIRATIAGFKKYYSHDSIVIHKKIIKKNSHQERMGSLSYLCGGLAAYGFYAFQGVSECKVIFNNLVYDFFSNIKNSYFKKIIKGDFKLLYYLVLEGIYFLRGFLIAFIFAKIVPIPKKENVVRLYYFRK
ncbi:MAG: glycosyltransferase family 2 protein [Pseudomonadales bacterium]|nr:glycosyltransferase family 2 protein [Pseudomonadales bacterium]